MWVKNGTLVRMMPTSQSFSGLLISGATARAIGNALQRWSQTEDADILAVYRSHGEAGGGYMSPQDVERELGLIERGEPEAVRVTLSSYSIAGRTYARNPFGTNTLPSTVESLAVWIDEQLPTHLSAEFTVSRPAPITVTLHGGGAWATATAEAGKGTGFYLIPGFESTGSPDVALDLLSEELAPFVQSTPEDTRGNRVFLGHGHGSDWRILEEKIQAAGFEPQAFESSVAAGAVNIYVIDTAIRGSFAAVLYMTPDDMMGDGSKRARQNVVHEVGFAQGVLGVQNVIVVQNDEVQIPSNIDGVTVVRVKSNGLYDKLDEVIAYLQKIKSAPIRGGV